jgi:hypothetical protein
MDDIGRVCSTMEEKKSAYRLLVGNPEVKRPIGRSRCRWVHNVEMGLGVLWTGLITKLIEVL